MHDGAPPPLELLPFNEPPSIETSVQEHLNVIHAIEEMRESQRILNQNHSRLADAISVDRLTLGRVEKLATELMRDVGLLMAHLGVKRG